jgi:CubicO group peptidase (beta-lactamase class C family)
MRLAPALLLAALFAAPALPAQLGIQTPGVSAARLRGLTATLEDYVATGALVGGELLVLRDGKPIYQHAFGTATVVCLNSGM